MRLLPVLLLFATPLVAQVRTEPEIPVQRFEIGAEYAYLGTNTCYYRANCERPPSVAFGPSIAVNVSRHFSIDSTFLTLVKEQQPPTPFADYSVAGGRGTALLTGPRFQIRRPKYSLFVFGQAGFEHWSQAPGPSTITVTNNQVNFYRTSAPQTYISAGGGLGAEYTPTPRLHIRASVGERYVLYRPIDASSVTSSNPNASASHWRGNEDFTLGVWTGIGPNVRGSGLLTDHNPTHRFFDRTNLLLIIGANAAGTTDAVVPRHFIFRGISEGDALERPFIHNGIGGFIAVGLITEAASIGFMYGLHHMGYHKLERLFPIAVMLGEGRTDYQVVRDTY